MTDYSTMSDADLQAAYAAQSGAPPQKLPADMTNDELVAAHTAATTTAAANQKYSGAGGLAKAFVENVPGGAVDMLGGIQKVGTTAFYPRDVLAKGVKWMADKAGYTGDIPLPLRENLPNTGEMAHTALGLPKPEDLPESVQSAGYAGNFTGGALAGAVGLEGAALRAGKSAADPILKWVANHPIKFAATELGSTATGATGTSIANSLSNGDPRARAIGGLIGSLASPFGAAGWAASKAAAAPYVGGMVNKVKSMFDPVQGAADNLGSFIASRGENPATVTAPTGAPATVGTNSQAIHDVATSLAKNNPQFGRDLTQAEGAATDATGATIGKTLAGTGSATDLAQAATSHVNRLDNIVSRAEDEARALTSKVAPNDVASAEALNVKARGLLEGALRSARATENNLWGKVDQTAPVPFTNTQAAFKTVKDGMLPDATLPPIIEKTVARFSDPANKPTLQDVQNLRSELLNQARVARGAGDFSTARNLGTLASGALDDMSAVGGPAAVEARGYSRALNDRFTRTFAGDVLGTSESGAAAVRPEQTLDAALSGKPTEAALRLRELQQASAPIGQGPPNPAMAQTQQQYVQQLGRNVIGPNGIVDPKKAGTLLNAQQAVLAQFPQYTGNMQAAIGGAQKAAKIADTAETAAAPAQSVLSNTENPGAVISGILKPSNNAPIASLDALHNIASQSPQGIAGLRATIGAHVMQDNNTLANIDRLMKPIRPGQPSLLDWAEKRGVIAPEDAAAIRQHADQVQNFAKLRTSAVGGADLEGTTPDLANLAARVVGAKIGGKVGSGEGSALTIAGYGSRTAQRYLNRMGVKGQDSILQDALLGRNGKSVNKLLELYKKSNGVVNGQKLQPPSFFMRPSAQSAAMLGVLYPQGK